MSSSRESHNTTGLLRGVSAPRGSSASGEIPINEWRTFWVHRPNVLVQGSESLVENTLVALKRDFLSNAYDWSQVADLTTVPVETIIVRNVGSLNESDRLKLMAWLELAHPHVQVISTSTTPLYSLVELEEFPADLYYRLNALTLDAFIIGGRSTGSSRGDS